MEVEFIYNLFADVSDHNNCIELITNEKVVLIDTRKQLSTWLTSKF